jgi:hypothetical protein
MGRIKGTEILIPRSCCRNPDTRHTNNAANTRVVCAALVLRRWLRGRRLHSRGVRDRPLRTKHRVRRVAIRGLVNAPGTKPERDCDQCGDDGRRPSFPSRGDRDVTSFRMTGHLANAPRATGCRGWSSGCENNNRRRKSGARPCPLSAGARRRRVAQGPPRDRRRRARRSP